MKLEDLVSRIDRIVRDHYWDDDYGLSDDAKEAVRLALGPLLEENVKIAAHVPVTPGKASMNTLIERLRGIYRIPVNDGVGSLDGISEMVREFETSAICHEAAARIELLESVIHNALMHLQTNYDVAHSDAADELRKACVK